MHQKVLGVRLRIFVHWSILGLYKDMTCEVGLQELQRRPYAAKHPLCRISLCREQAVCRIKPQEQLTVDCLVGQPAKIPAATGASEASKTSLTMCKRISDRWGSPCTKLGTA